MPSPEIPTELTFSIRVVASSVEGVLEWFGVPFGVTVGVVPALSERCFRDDERGVMFVLRKVLTGVETPSFGVNFRMIGVAGAVPARRRTGERVAVVPPAMRGVKGGRPFFVVVLRAGNKGRVARELLLW